MRALALASMALLLMAGSAPPPGTVATVTTRLGKTFDVGSIKVTPLQVVEDKRCPRNVDCAAEPLRLRVLVLTPVGSHQRVLVEGVPQTITGGKLLLREATPLPDPARAIAPDAYRFVLRYSQD